MSPKKESAAKAAKPVSEKKSLSDKKKKEVIAGVIEALRELYPDAGCSLDNPDGEPWKLLVAARLSAQCTDERVNVVTKELFAAFPTVQAMADAELSGIEEYIRPCGLYHGKAKSIKESCTVLCEKYGGRVPDTMEELLGLPGVGRKIANLILGDVYGKGGIVADTHCIRITGRLGLTEKQDPLCTERTLDPLVPKEEQSALCHRLVDFGRDVCCARNPHCAECILKDRGLCGGSGA